MSRLAIAVSSAGILICTGCGFEFPSACPGMTAQEYAATRSVLTYYAQAAKAGGMTKDQFVAEIDKMEANCDLYGALFEALEEEGVPPIPASEACECFVSLFRDIAEDVW